MFYRQLKKTAKNAGTNMRISGHHKRVLATKQKQNFSDARNANTHGENTNKKKTNFLTFP
jgi:hypothetical protein